MSSKVAINGLGRLGRSILRSVIEEPSFGLVAVNDLVDAEDLAYLLRFDTVYGRYAKPVAVNDDDLVIVGRRLRTLRNRDPLDLPFIAPHVQSLLLGGARIEGAWLGFVDNPAHRRALASVMAEAKRRPGRDPSSGLAPAAGGRVRPARVHSRVASAPTVAVLLTRGDTPTDWLVAGQALARVLLTARAAGVAPSYLDPLTLTPGLRREVAGVVWAAGDPGVPGRRGGMPSDAVPQVVLRLGYSPREQAPRPFRTLEGTRVRPDDWVA